MAAPTPSKLLRSSHWAGLAPGDAVVIDQPRERSGAFVFVAHVRNLATGDEWVEVRGGRQGEGKDRSFRADCVYPASARRRGRLVGPSLADAPRLPLGSMHEK